MDRVEWLQDALDELTAAWILANSSERQAITLAAQRVDQLLQADPDEQGESRSAGRRIAFVAPLAVTFQIDAVARTVTVLHVRFYRPRKT